MTHTIEKRDYQIAAVNAVIEKFKVIDRVQLHMAPGTGKTIVSLLVKEAMNPSLTAVFVPTIQLLHQQFYAWEYASTKSYRSLAVVCDAPDQSFDDLENGPRNTHDGATTDSESIKQFINASGDRVIFCTYKSAHTLIEAMENTSLSIDLAIFDEAHRIAGSYEKHATQLLDDESIAIQKRLFLTATPKVLKNQKDCVEMAGMDDVFRFGEVAYTLPFREALTRNILVDYQIVAATVSENDLKSINIKGSRDEKTLLAAILKSIDTYNLKKGLTFHSNVANAKRFSLLLRQLLPSNTYVDTLNGSHSAKYRANVLSQLKNAEKSILTNVRVLGEGFDFTELDHIVFIDPKNSPVDIIQNIGRVMRKHEGKKIGTIIIPLFVSKRSDRNSYRIDSSRFSSIFRIASAIGSIDTMFADLIGRYSANTIKNKPAVRRFIGNHIKVIGVGDLDEAQIRSIEDKIKLYVISGSKLGLYWEDSFNELKAFCEIHNRLPRSHIPEEKRLYSFAFSCYRPNIEPQRKALLEDIVATYRTKKFSKLMPIEEQFAIFEAWVRKNKRFPYNGKCRSRERVKAAFEISGMTVTEEELYLGQWLLNRAPKHLTPELRTRMTNLKEWVEDICPMTLNVIKKLNLRCQKSTFKARMHELGVKPHFCLAIKGSKVRWDIEEVKAALSITDSSDAGPRYLPKKQALPKPTV